MARYFLLGLLVGWLFEWIIDWVWWRRRRGDEPAVAEAGAAARVDDLTRLEGVGPAIAGLLADAGIRSFADLALAPSPRLAGILAQAGPNFRLANPGTWPEQALLAARGEWEALDRLQAQLRGGVRASTE